MLTRRHSDVVAFVLANNLAGIAWALAVPDADAVDGDLAHREKTDQRKAGTTMHLDAMFNTPQGAP